MELAADPVHLYTKAPDDTRQQLNATFFERFYLDDEPLAVVRDRRKPPFDELQATSWVYRRYKERAIEGDLGT